MRRVSICLLTSLLLASALTLLPRAAVCARASTEPVPVFASAAQDDASAFWKQAKEYYDAGRFAEAAEAYKQYIRLRPEVAEARYWLARPFYSLKQYADAAAAFREAVRLKPDYRQAYVFLANSLDYADRYEEAVAAYRRA